MRIFWRTVWLCFALVVTSAAQTAVSHPWRGAAYTFEKRAEPRLEIHSIILDLKRVKLRAVPAGPDPDGDGKWQTVLMPTSKIAEREGFDVAINGDFYAIPRGEEAEAAKALNAGGVPALVTGAAATDGKAWSKSARERQCLIADRKQRIRLADVATAPPDAAQVICGRDFLVVQGKARFSDEGVTYKPGEFRGVNPRTAVGIDKQGKRLIILVVDGRSELSRGMTYGQLAAEMVRLGAWTAINLDGGGSSTLVIRDQSGALKVLNRPSDGKERAVANALGLTFKKK